MSEKEYLVALCAFSYFGPQRVKLMLSYFGTAESIWNGKKQNLINIGIPASKAQEFDSFKKAFDIKEYFQKLKKLNIKAVTYKDRDFPQNLNGLKGMPQVLYVRGEYLPSDSLAVAIVGSRMITSYGREVANRLATNLAAYGVTVVSGLAFGVDIEAQKSAFKAGGRTISVLASGLNIVSPYTHSAFASELITKGKGALISEYPLGHEPFRSDFAIRNRLISALSKAVVVVESKMNSGSFYTVSAAADQGRPVFAVPGPITSPTSEGPNYLIQNGAKIVTSVKDILDELSVQTQVDTPLIKKVMPQNPEEEKLLKTLSKEPLHLDELVRILGLAADVVSARLTIMEIKGLVKNLGNGTYSTN